MRSHKSLSELVTKIEIISAEIKSLTVLDILYIL